MIRKNNSISKRIALTSTNEAGIITQFLSRGGHGYLLEKMGRAALLTTIDELMNNKIFLSKTVNQKILEQYNSVSHVLKIPRY